MLILGRDTMKDPSLGYARTLRPAGRGLPRPGARAGREDRQQRRRPQPGRARRPAPRGRQGARARRRRRARRGRRPPRRSALRRSADRQRLPRRLRHRGGTHARAPTSWSPAGSPTPPSSSVRRSRTTAGRRRRTTSWPAPWSPATSSSAAPRPPAATSPASAARARRHGPGQAARLPGRRDRGRRLQRDHQARRHRRRGHGRHRHRAAGLRDPVDPLPQPRRDRPSSTRSSSAQDGPDRVAISGVRGEAPPERLKVCVNELGGFRNQVEFVLTGLDVEEKARVGSRAAHAALATAAGEVAWSRVAPAARRRHRGGRVGPAPLHGHGPAARPGRPGVHRPGRRARAGVLPRLHDDHPAAQPTPYGVYRPEYVDRAEVVSTRSCTPTGAVRRSRTPPTSRSADPDTGGARRRTPLPPTR